jgi:phosphopentomutase
MKFGHRNDPKGYANALIEFDNRMPELLEKLNEGDILIITADHGNDPTTESTDHSREYTPLLIYGKHVKKGINLGIRDSFSDIGQTICDMLNLPKLQNGESFKKLIIS